MKVILFGHFPGTSSEESLHRGLEKANCEVIRFDFRKRFREIGQKRCEDEMIMCVRKHEPDLALFCKIGELSPRPIVGANKVCKTFFWYMDALHYYNSAKLKMEVAHNSGIALYEVYKKAREDRIKNCHFVLDGYDPEWDMFMPEIDLEYVACFVGNLYGRRLKYLQEVRSFDTMSGIFCKEHSKVINRTGINLGFTNSGLWPHNGPSARTYKILACKGFLLLERFPYMDKYPFKEDRDFIGFSTFNELRDKIQHFRYRPDERHEIAEQGYKTIKPYSRYRTVRQILKISGLGGQ